jgi:hypothetical protein
MIKKKLLFKLIMAVGIVPISMSAQEGTVASGGDATGAGGNVSYSIGQINYVSATIAGDQVNQGIQQAFEIFAYTGIEEKTIDLNYSAYPNPTNGHLNLKVDRADYSSLKYMLTSIDGRSLAQDDVVDKNTTISMQGFASGTYVLTIIQGSKKIKSYNIIKN